MEAVDPVKDQTYYLSQIPAKVLSKTLFPVGGLLKSQVKRIAEERGFASIAERKESMGICFVGKRPFGEFVEQYLPQNPGDFISPEGVILGRYAGMAHFTIGQRARVPGMKEK